MFQILIVEDDKELSQLFQKVLEKNGYQVKSAPDGAQALEVLDKEYIDLPSAAVFLHKAGEFRMKVPKITAELPRLPGRGFFAVRHTAPGAQAPLGIVDALPGRFDWFAILIMKQKPSRQDGQHPVESLKVQNGIEGEAAQIGGVLFVPGGVIYRTGVVLKFLPLIQHGPPPKYVPQCGRAAGPTAGSAYPGPPHRVPPDWAVQSYLVACGRPWTPRPAHCR